MSGVSELGCDWGRYLGTGRSMYWNWPVWIGTGRSMDWV